ncbi:MAG: hypothetical protein EBZ77_09520, partial [Chitinophagia bacterium]|nr:hypothetical protein [Chitinophagia bacterium]
MVLDKKHIPLYKRALSFIKPVWLSGGSSPINPRLEVLLYHDRIQLATGDALYSDGKYYTPATEIAKYLDKDLPQFEQVLMLGVGLGSLVDVLAEKGCTPAFTLVEKDEVVLRLATNYLQKWPKLQLTP